MLDLRQRGSLEAFGKHFLGAKVPIPHKLESPLTTGGSTGQCDSWKQLTEGPAQPHGPITGRCDCTKLSHGSLPQPVRPCQATPQICSILHNSTGQALPRSLPVPLPPSNSGFTSSQQPPQPLLSQVPLVRNSIAPWHPDPLASVVEILYTWVSLRAEPHLILLVSLFSPLSWAWHDVGKSCPSFGPLSTPASYKTICCCQLTGQRSTSELLQTLWSGQFLDQPLTFCPSGLSNRLISSISLVISGSEEITASPGSP